METYQIQLIQTTFTNCFGLKSCLKSVRTQNDAIIALSERTGLRKQFIVDNLVEICNL